MFNRVKNSNCHMTHHLFAQWPASIAKLSILSSLVLSVPFSAQAQTIESIDTRPNDTFGDRVTVSSGATRIYGELTPVDIPPADYVTENILSRGSVDEVTLTDLTPGNSFFAWITLDNSNNMDPIMGLFDADGNLMFWDDDSSPTAALAPALRGTIGDDGTLTLKVSGIGDDDFDGNEIYYYGNDWESGEIDESSAVTEPHYQSGEYTLSVITNAVELRGDVDFFTLSGLTPGYRFTVEDSMSEGGVTLGWMADNGTVASVSAPSDATYREQIEGIVPATGQIHIAVSGYGDASLKSDQPSSSR